MVSLMILTITSSLRIISYVHGVQDQRSL